MTSIFLATAVVVAAPALKDKPNSADLILGEWAVETYILGGKEVPPGVRVRFDKDGKAAFSSGPPANMIEGNYTLDAKKSPAEIDIRFGDQAAGAMIGIFKMDGDALVLCFGPEGGRPGEFKSPADTAIGLITFRRIKGKD